MKKISLIFSLILLCFLTSCSYSTEATTYIPKNKNFNKTDLQTDSNTNTSKTFSEKKETQVEKPQIKPSTVLELISKKIEDNPKILTTELLDFGNELIQAKGYNFSFYTCSIANPESEPPANDFSEDFTAFDYSFVSLNGKKFDLQILSKSWGHPCGCYFEVPLIKASNNELIIKQIETVYPIKYLDEYNLEYVELVSKDLKNIKRKWFQPMDIIPFGVSKDGTKIYVETNYDNDNLNISEKSLVLEIAENGTFRFVSKKDPNIISKYEYIEDFPKDPKNDYLGYLKFSNGKIEHILKVSFPCT